MAVNSINHATLALFNWLSVHALRQQLRLFLARTPPVIFDAAAVILSNTGVTDRKDEKGFIAAAKTRQRERDKSVRTLA